MFSDPSSDPGLQGQGLGWSRERRRDCVLPKRGCSGQKTCSYSQDDENNFHLKVNQHRLVFVMAVMSEEEKVVLVLLNPMVWGVFNESKACRCVPGAWVK